MDAWVGVVMATAPKYLKGASDETQRGRLLFAMLKNRGRYEYNQSGTHMFWQIEYSQPRTRTWGGAGGMSFENHNAFLQLQMDWRGYVATDAMPKIDQLMNKGDQALINVFQTKMNRLTKSVKNTLSGEFFKDGNDPNRPNAIHGLETFLGEDPGQTVVGDICAKASDSYGGYNTGLGQQSGSWSANRTTKPNTAVGTDWPFGQGSSEYDCLTPKLFNWSSTGWGTGTNTWLANCWSALSAGILLLTVTGGEQNSPDICPMDPSMFHDLKKYQEAKTRELIPHKEASDLGFGSTLNIDGVAVYPEYDCPADTAYLKKLSQVTVSCLTPELIWMEGPDKDPRSGWGHLFGVGMFGNIKWRPKHIAKYKNYAAA